MYLFRTLFAIVLLLTSCASKKDLPPMITAGSGNNARANELFQQAFAAEQNGSTKKAIKLYQRLSKETPFAQKAPEAQFRQAQLYDKQGEYVKAFDAYQLVIARYTSSGLYKPAFKRQIEIAHDVNSGEIKNSFLGLKSKIRPEKRIEMLNTIASNSPRTDIAAKAQFTISEVYVEQKKITEATQSYHKVVTTYPNSDYGAEAQFRIGKVLLEEARRGNQDQANLDAAEKALKDYLAIYPSHRHAKEARALLNSIGSRDVQNTYEIARFYEGKKDYRSAHFYYEEVMRLTKSGALYDQAKARLAAMGKAQ